MRILNKKKYLIIAVFVLCAINHLTSLAATIQAQYSYDTDNRLTQVTYSNGRTIVFTYDNNGNLTNVNATSKTTTGPIVNTQPLYHPVETGETLTLSVTASGSGLTYKWYKNEVALENGGDISGADSESLSIANLDEDDEDSYYCIITDADSNTVTTDTINVFVLTDDIIALWNSATSLAPGSRFKIYSFELPGQNGEFTSKPKLVMGELLELIKGKHKTYPLSLITAPSTLVPTENLQCLWTKAVLLYNKKSIKNYYKSGYNCSDLLGFLPQYGKDAYVKIQVTGSTVQYLNRLFTLVPPDITDVKDENEAGSISSAEAGDIITIIGDFFGEKAPKIWMEYKVTDKPEVKMLKLKALKPFEYTSGKGKAAASCMDIDTGASKIKVQIPDSLPKGLIKGDNNIVIDNKQGLATFTFDLQ